MSPIQPAPRRATAIAVLVAVQVVVAGCAAAPSPPALARSSATAAAGESVAAPPSTAAPASQATASRSPERTSTPSPSPTPDPYAGSTASTVESQIIALPGADVGYMGVTRDAVWAATSIGLMRIDPRTLDVQAVDDAGRFGLAAGPDVVWTTDFEKVARYPPTATKPTVEVPLLGNPNAVAILGDSVWVAQHRRGAVTRLTEPDGTIVAQVDVGPPGPSGPQGVAADDNGVWVGIPNSRSVVRIDPTTNKVVATIATTTSACGGIALQPDAVWVSSCFDDHYAVRIDPRANSNVAEIDIGGNNGGAVLVDGFPWFPVNNTLVRIDPATNRIDRVVTFTAGPFSGFGSTIGFDSVWVSALDGRVARIALADLADLAD